MIKDPIAEKYNNPFVTNYYKKYDSLIQQILSSFTLPENFGFSYSDRNDLLESFCKELSNKINSLTPITIRSGASKLVIVLKNYDFVIKIPFNGSVTTLSSPPYSSIPDSLSTAERYKWIRKNSETFFENFTGAEGEDPEDYCLTELKCFHEVVEDGYADFLADICYYGTKDGHRIYIQEKVLVAEDRHYAISVDEKTREEASSLSQNFYMYDYLPDDWWAAALNMDGIDKVADFLSYLEDDPRNLDLLNDMHSGNYGYKMDGQPCLLDYSGFDE